MTRTLGLFLICFAFLFMPDAASADCSSPVAVAGNVQWIAASSEVQYCDGTYWKSASVSALPATCSAAETGKIVYQSSDLQFCNGSNWISMNGASLGTSCATAGTLTYDSAATTAKWCDGTNWKRVGSNQVAIAFAGSASSNSDLTTYNFGSVPIGVATANRYVLVAISARSASSFVPSSVTVGGITATQVTPPHQIGGTVAAFYIAAVPSGTTAAIAVTFSGQMVRAIVETWSITNLLSTSPISTYNFDSSLSTVISIPAGAAAFGLIGGTQTGTVGAFQWNAGGLTNNNSVHVDDDFNYSAAAGSLAAPNAVSGKTVSASVTNGGSSSNRASQIITLR